MPDTETVTLKLPSGEEIDAIVPSGLDDAGVKSLMQMKHPELIGPPGGGVKGVKPPPVPRNLQTPTDFSSRIGQRIEQNAYMVPKAIDQATGASPFDPTSSAAAKHFAGTDSPTTLGKVVGAATIVPRFLYDQGKSYLEDPARAVGDVVTMAPELAEARFPGDKTYGRKPVESGSMTPPSLSPDQQAKYTESIDKANAEYREKSQAYHEKMSKLFDEAKREAIEAQKEHTQKTETAKQAHADKVAKAQADFEAEVASGAKSKGEWQAKMDAVNESKRQAAAVEADRRALQQEQQGHVATVRQGAQELYANIKQTIKNAWDSVRDQLPLKEDTAVPTTKIVNTVNRAIKEELLGSPGNLRQFKDLMKQLGMDDFVDEGDGLSETSGKPENWDSDWKTLRVHSSALGRALAAGDLPANVYRSLKMVRESVEGTLGDVAASYGAGDAYKQVKAADHAFRNDFEDLGNVALGEGQPISRLVRAPSDTFAADQILGKPGDILVKNLNKWDATGKLGKAVERARAIRTQIKSLPRVTVLREPPPFQGATPTLQTIPPPDLPEKPGIPEAKKAYPVPPELQEVKRPTPEPPKKSAAKAPGWLRKLARIGGGSAGAAAASTLPYPLKHPFMAYREVGRAAESLADRMYPEEDREEQ
jgi:hypothetical protein